MKILRITDWYITKEEEEHREEEEEEENQIFFSDQEEEEKEKLNVFSQHFVTNRIKQELRPK